MPALTDMPNVVLNQIASYLDYTAILSLRKVCQSLRNHLIDTKPDLKLSKILLPLSADVLQMELEHSEGMDIIEYKSLPHGGSLITNGYGGVKTMENEHFADLFFSDLKVIMEHQKSVLDVLHLTQKFDMKEGKDQSYIYEFGNFLKLKQPLLKTKQFIFEMYTDGQLMSILPYLDPKHLKRFALMKVVQPNYRIANRTLKTHKLEELEQWKNLETLLIRDHIAMKSIRNFSHFQEAYISVHKLVTRDLVYLKETLLQSSNFRKMVLNYYKNVKITDIFDKLNEQYSDSIYTGNQNNLWWFRFESSEDVLQIKNDAAKFCISFERIPSDKVVFP